MDVATALFAAAAVLLIIAGMAKVMRPSTTADMLLSLGVREVGYLRRERVAVVLGIVETGIGIGALTIGGPVAAATVGVFYVGFAAAVLRALSVGAVSCGCFGRVDAPPSWLHVVGNTAFAAASFVAIAGSTPVEVMDDQRAGGIGFVVLVGVLAGLALVMFTALPEALAARRPRVGA